MSWFNDVTGTNDYERQSWRDSYNGGRAAGDLTGNVNARLDAERGASGGYTNSGSSTQYSAFEASQRGQGAGHGVAASGNGASKGGSGPGNSVVKQGADAPTRPAGGSGPGSRLTISGPLKTKTQGNVTGLELGGGWFEPNGWFSNADQWEERWGEPGDWIGGIAVGGADIVFNVGRFVDWGFDADTVSNKRRDGNALGDWVDTQLAGPGAWSGIQDSIVQWDRQVSRRLNDVLTPGRALVGGGF